MGLITCQAIVLSSFNYRDYDRITTLYSQDQGLIKLIVHGANRPKSNRLIFCQPFTLLELTYLTKKGEIHHFREGKILNPNLNLRDSYEALEAASQLLDITSKSQMPEEPSSQLFLLLTTYLKKIPEFKNPYILSQSYLLKTLLMQGLWTIQTQCSSCQKALEDFYFSSKGYCCKSCAPLSSVRLNLDEMECITALVQERSFKELEKLDLKKSLQEKIEKIFLMSHS